MIGGVGEGESAKLGFTGYRIRFGVLFRVQQQGETP